MRTCPGITAGPSWSVRRFAEGLLGTATMSASHATASVASRSAALHARAATDVAALGASVLVSPRLASARSVGQTAIRCSTMRSISDWSARRDAGISKRG
jgi:hypothetical protein